MFGTGLSIRFPAWKPEPFMEFAIPLIWILFGAFSAVIASSRNRSAIGWFFVGVLAGPFGLLVAVLPRLEPSGTSSAAGEESTTERTANVAMLADAPVLDGKAVAFIAVVGFALLAGLYFAATSGLLR